MSMLCLQEPKEGMADHSAPLPVPLAQEDLPTREVILLVSSPPGLQWGCASLRLCVCFGLVVGSLRDVLWVFGQEDIG